MWDVVSDHVALTLTRIPFISIVASLGLCTYLSSGLIGVRFEKDVRKSFSPENSLAGYETRVYLEFHNFSVFPQKTFVLFKSVDGGDILRKDRLNEVLRFDSEMKKALEEEGSDEASACYPLCHVNRPFYEFLKQIKMPPNQYETNLTFPITRVYGARLFLGLHINGITWKNNSDDTGSPFGAESIVLYYFSRADTPSRKNIFRETTLRWFAMSKNDSFSPIVKYHIFGDEISNHEMVRGSLEATYLMTIGFAFLVVFVVMVVLSHGSIKVAPSLVVATIGTPLISTSSSFGLLAWLGQPLYSMQCVTPFLVLGIGVDDAFIMMHRWRARGDERDACARLRAVIVDVGPSITITSITNIIAFGVGFFTPTPQLSLFCLATSLALLFDYLFTYSILAPVIFLCGEREEYRPVGLQEKTEVKEKEWLTKYCKLVTSLNGRLLCLAALMLIYGSSTMGVVRMKCTFEPAKAFPSDSALVLALNSLRPVFNEFFMATIFVNKPPNISDHSQYSTFYELIGRLESLDGSYGRNVTQLFLIEYESFDREASAAMNGLFFGEHEYKPSLENLPFWLDLIGNPPSIKWHENSETGEIILDGFPFALMAKGMSEWAHRALFIDNIRRVLKDYPQFNATVYDHDGGVLSLILTVADDLVGSIAVTVACMAVVCLFFITDRFGVVLITYVITSICYTLVGFLSWWGADLDPVTQVDVLLATGFSVDYTAHVAFHFYKSRGSPAERIYQSLDEMAYPMIQAGMSTFLCMLPLIFVKTYAIVAFAKTIFIVVAVGLLHGLFILPVVLTLFCRTAPPPAGLLPKTELLSLREP